MMVVDYDEPILLSVEGDALQTCSGAEYIEMDCSCLASAYNLRECPERLNNCKYNFIDSYTRQIIFWHVPKIS